MLKDFHDFKKLNSLKVLDQIKESALNQKNIFEVLMEATKHCSLGQITVLFSKSVVSTEEICRFFNY